MGMDDSLYTIYTARNCQWCVKAIDIMGNLGLDLNVISIRHNKEAIAVLQTLNLNTVPQIFKGETLIGGYDDMINHLYKEGLLTRST